jgi:transposase
MPNDINFPLTAINNHNGVISNETRLILVLDSKSHIPIYFRYAAGNIVDVTTLKATVAELREYGIDITQAIIDAGYFSEKNIKELYKCSISFITRMKCNLKLYKTLVAEHKSDLENAKHLVKYRERFVYIKRVQVNLHGNIGYAYIGSDIDRKHDEIKRYINNAFDNNDISFDEMDIAIQSKGIFILVSSKKLFTILSKR